MDENRFVEACCWFKQKLQINDYGYNMKKKLYKKLMKFNLTKKKIIKC